MQKFEVADYPVSAKLLIALRYEEQLERILHYVAEELHNKTAVELICKDIKEAYRFLTVFPMATPVCSDEIKRFLY